MRRTAKRASFALGFSLVLGLAACTDEAGQARSDVGSAETTPTSGETSGTADLEESTTTSTTAAIDEEVVEIPGDFFDIGPREGERLDVVNVRFDDVLNFRALPDASAPILDTVAPRANSPEVISAGEGRLFENSAWWRVRVDGVDAWANFAFLGMLGRSQDLLTEVVGELGSDEAASIEALIEAIVVARSGGGPDLRVTLVSRIEELPNGSSQVTIDLDGLGDDAAKGDRLLLLVRGTEGDTDGGIRLVGLTRNVICSRGVSDGLCL